ncbi:MAG: hybrid sensor histidine kinase/response regulator [Acidobacteriota bacterium]|nr:hybrid sensor histidine kinase/response regulator [Acidobacteriota bacterium]
MTPETHHQKGSIVVIDDTPANLRLLAGMLMKSGYKVRPMPSGELGLKTVRAFPPDLILLDINMPGMNGYEVCQKLKEDRLTRGIPVIFISALGESLDKVKAFNAGGVDYITKPFQVEEVQARIRTQLDLKFSRDVLEKMNADLQRSLDEKNEFLTILVNELKNPLNVMMGYSEMLVEDAGHLPGEEVKAVGTRMTDTSKKMHELVVKILEVNRLELGQKEFIMKQVDLNAVICGTLANFERAAADKGLTVSYVQRRRFPAVQGDETCIYSIVENLISNAVKFTGRGGSVTVILEQEGDTARCRIEDTGPGFTAEDKRRMFAKYARLSARPTAGESSTGLGLSIVKALIDAHGGCIHLSSRPGEGACFTFSLPLADQVED